MFLDLVERERETFMVQGDLGEDLGLSLFEGIQRSKEELNLPTPLREPGQ